MTEILPRGWIELPLEKCVEILDSKRIPVNNTEREVLIKDRPVEELVPYYGATGQVGYIDNHIFDEDLILLGEDGVSFYDLYKHKAYLISGKSWVNNHAHVLKGLKGVSDDFYICQYLNQFNYQGYITGSTRLKLNQSSMRNIPVKLAPYDEQKRISDILEQLLSAVEATKSRLDKVSIIIKRFRQSILAAATSGDLTKDWRSARKICNNRTGINTEKKLIPTDYHLPLNWRWDSVGNLIQAIESGKNIQCEERAPGLDQFGIIKISAVTWGYFNEEESKTLISKELFWEHRRIKEGDLLISRANTLELLGAPVIVNAIERNLMLSDKVLRLLCDNDYKEWLNLCLRSPLGRFQIEQLATGNQLSMRNISQGNLKRIHIPDPGKEEIKVIVQRVNGLLNLVDELEGIFSSSIKKIEKLSASILSKAFRGKLVPQDPNDESAEKQLNQIKASNIAFPKHKKKPNFTRETTASSERNAMTIAKAVTNLDDLIVVLESLKEEVTAERLASETGLLANIDLYYELLREGRDSNRLDVPVGTNAPIRKI